MLLLLLLRRRASEEQPVARGMERSIAAAGLDDRVGEDNYGWKEGRKKERGRTMDGTGGWLNWWGGVALTAAAGGRAESSVLLVDGL